MQHIQFCTESGKFELCFRHAIAQTLVQDFNVIAIIIDRAPICVCCAAEDGHGVSGYNMNSAPIQALLRAIDIVYWECSCGTHCKTVICPVCMKDRPDYVPTKVEGGDPDVM